VRGLIGHFRAWHAEFRNPTVSALDVIFVTSRAHQLVCTLVSLSVLNPASAALGGISSHFLPVS